MVFKPPKPHFFRYVWRYKTLAFQCIHHYIDDLTEMGIYPTQEKTQFYKIIMARPFQLRELWRLDLEVTIQGLS